MKEFIFNTSTKNLNNDTLIIGSNRSAYQSSDLYRRWRSDTALQTIIRGKAVVADSDACIPDGRTALHPLDGRT